MISRENLEDLYPLSPLQEGMLFEALQDARAATHFEQSLWYLDGALEPGLFRQAWTALVGRHGILRTRIIAEKATRPLQAVLRQVEPDIHLVDLTGLDPASQEARIAAYRLSDRADPPKVTGPHLLRLALFTLSADRCAVLLSFHHILLDGWSLGLLLQDFFSLYQAMRLGQPLPANDWPRYGRFIQHLESLDREAGRHFWQSTLADVEAGGAAPLPLRLRQPGQAMQEDLEHPLDPVRGQAVEALARRLAVTPGNLFQALWGLWLMRHSDRQEALFGAVVSGRPGELEGAERLIGLCINTIPVRIIAQPGDSFASFVRRAQAEAAEALAWQHLPLAETQPAGTAIQSLYAFENYPRDGGGIGTAGLSVSRVEAIEETPYPLALIVVPNRTLTLILKYDRRVYDQPEAERFLGRFLALLDQAIAAPDASLASFEALAEGEAALLAEFGAGPEQELPAANLNELFAQSVASGPQEIAVRDEGLEVTYEALDHRATLLARALLATPDWRQGAIVAVILGRSAALAAAFLGVMRAGGVYLPIDPALPRERIRLMLDDSKPMLVINGDHWPEVSASSPVLPLPVLGPRDPAYLIYTSGSTGRPKGALVAHGGLVNLFAQVVPLQQMGPGRGYAFFHSPSFDASIWEMLSALLSGGRLEVAAPEIVADPALFGAFLRRTRPHAAIITPGYLRLLDPEDVGVLSCLLMGGEAADPDLVARYGEALTVINAYGPTETSIAATAFLAKPPAAPAGSVPIGRSFANVEILILDSAGRVAPVGVAGEILIGGAGLGLGYLHRPDLTAERFIPHPFKPGAILYRSGDRGRWRSEGVVEFAGRADDQVKVRGNRIELGEIQAWLTAQPGVREAFALTRPDGAGDHLIHAYVTGSAEPEALLSALRRDLPDYMVPAGLVLLPHFPLTHAGKIDRNALPLPEVSGRAGLSPLPADPLEAGVLAIWREVLGQPGLGSHGGFREAGGHSLSAMRIVSRIRRELKRSLSFAEFFSHETVAELAALLRQREAESSDILPRLEGAAGGLTHAQRRIWFLAQLSDNPALYNIAASHLLTGPLDRVALAQALEKLVARHEALRSIFPARAGVPERELLPPGPVALDFDDFTGDPVAAQRAARRLGEMGFDLAQGPLFRVALYRLAENRHLLAVSLHHIIGDGWSMEVITQDLTRLYRGESLPPLPVPLSDAVHWLNQRTTRAGEARRYWLDRFAEPVAALDLPTDHPRPPRLTQEGGIVRLSLDPRLIDQLAALGGAGTTRFMALVALVKAVLHRHSGQTDLVIGHPIAGRDHGDLEPLVGCFVNTLALRDRLAPDWSFRRLMETVRRSAVEAFEYQHYPFDLLVEELALPRLLNRNPLFDVMLAYNRPLLEAAEFSGLTSEAVASEVAVAKFDLLFEFDERDQAIETRILFARDLWEPETIARLANHLSVLAAAAIAAPEHSLGRLDLLTPLEVQRQLTVYNPLPLPPPPLLPLHESFARQAALNPAQIALRWQGEGVSYGALDRQANRLARFLQTQGVGPDVPVGLSLGRSANLLLGMLAILKAGGAYVPLDPIYPEKRLRFIVEAVAAPVVLTDAANGEKFADMAARVIALDADSPLFESFSDAALPSAGSLESLAYIMFTSGSTGEPKGVEISHRNVARLFSATRPWFSFGPGDVFALFHSYGFDVSVFEIWGAWSHGASLVIVPSETTRSPEDFLALLAEERVSILCQTPSAFVPVVAADRGEALALRAIIFAGEALEPSQLRPWVARRGMEQPRLFNLYGPTEAAVYASYYCLRPEDLDQPGGAPIGEPLTDGIIRILDGQRRLLPEGAVGEIYLGGPGLARGYWRRPDLTTERFVADPYQPAARLYRSGDLGRYAPDGRIEYRGRIDHQVKIRGFRVELGEIESRLAAHPAISGAAVVARPLAGHLTLIAHVALGQPVEVEALRLWLGETLPDYMVPALILIQDHLPLNANGKVDRGALPDPEEGLLTRTSQPVPLETETEQDVAAIWSAVLERPGLARDDDFFALGGHSLNATKVVARINQHFGIALKIRVLFETPVLGDFALAVEDALIDQLDLAEEEA